MLTAMSTISPPLIDLVDSDVIVAVAAISDVDLNNATTGERDVVRNAVTTRREEFLAGRALARQLASDIGVDLGDLLVGRWREPLWPMGISGSISHTGSIVAVALRPGAEPIGIDVEHVGALDRDDATVIAHQRDRDRVDVSSAADRTLLLSVKECVVKAARYNGFIELADIEVTARDAMNWTLRLGDRRFMVRSAVGELAVKNATAVDHQLVWSTTVRAF
jgi:4'-phosphopantetheinyl transferase EntD